MTRPPPPDPTPPALHDLLLDALRGELDPSETRRLEAMEAQDPAAVRRERARLEGFLGRVAPVHQAPSEEVSVVARRIVARVKEQVGAEEARARRDVLGRRSRLRLAWGRILVVSVAVHAVLLTVLAVRLHQEQDAERQPRITATLPSPSLLPEDEAIWEEIPDSPWRPAPARALPTLPETDEMLAARAAGPDEALPPLAGRRYEHPPAVVAAMQVRTVDVLKRGRLQLLGFDADGTLRAVDRGLRALAVRQTPDGSFPAAGGRDAVGQTALALLPFLGDGHGSRIGDTERATVGRGIGWLRRALFDGRGEAVGARGAPASELGVALKALAEDYMLSYGRMPPREAERRAVELRSLGARVAGIQASDGSFPGAGEDIRLAAWPMWGLDAAARTGVVVPPAAVANRFRTWYQGADRSAPEGVAVGLLLSRDLGAEFGRAMQTDLVKSIVTRGLAPEDDAFLIAATGTALLLSDTDAFRDWSHGLDRRLIRGLQPTGVVREGDPVGDTALHLLALQVAYRTY